MDPAIWRFLEKNEGQYESNCVRIWRKSHLFCRRSTINIKLIFNLVYSRYQVIPENYIWKIKCPGRRLLPWGTPHSLCLIGEHTRTQNCGTDTKQASEKTPNRWKLNQRHAVKNPGGREVFFSPSLFHRRLCVFAGILNAPPSQPPHSSNARWAMPCLIKRNYTVHEGWGGVQQAPAPKLLVL